MSKRNDCNQADHERETKMDVAFALLSCAATFSLLAIVVGLVIAARRAFGVCV